MIASYPAPGRVEAQCLPEGRRIVTVSIDFTQLPITPATTFAFPELAIGAGSQTTQTYGGYQKFNVNLKQLQGGMGLSEVRGVIFYWRPTFGGSDFTQNADSALGLLITDLLTLQTIAIPSGDYNLINKAANVFNGSIPFYVSGDANIRFLIPVLDYVAALGKGQGKGMFQFCNFDIHPFNNQVNFDGSD